MHWDTIALLLRARSAAACKLNSRLLDRFLILGDMVQEQAGHLENPDEVERDCPTYSIPLQGIGPVTNAPQTIGCQHFIPGFST